MYRWPDGLPLTLEPGLLDVPRRLRLDGRWHTVEAVVTRWRVRQHWWRAPCWREYLTLATDRGCLVTLMRALPHGAWQLSQLYD